MTEDVMVNKFVSVEQLRLNSEFDPHLVLQALGLVLYLYKEIIYFLNFLAVNHADFLFVFFSYFPFSINSFFLGSI